MRVTIISGEKNSAKTTTLKQIVESNPDKYIGYTCLSYDNKNSFYLKNILTNNEFLIMQNTKIDCEVRLGQYYIIDGVFELISNILLQQIKETKNKIIALDEIGKLELDGFGYDKLLNELVELDNDIVLCIRDKFVNKVIKKYNLKNIDIIKV